MNIIDVSIILVIILGMVIGFKNGVLKQTIKLVGLILVIYLAFIFKNPVSSLMYTYLPFFNFDGIFKGITALNIILYETIAFFLVLGLLTVLLRILIFISGVIERILTLTIVLGIPSKILGIIVGGLTGFIYVFIILVIINQPVFNIKILADSKLNQPIISKTPVLAPLMHSTIKTFNEIYDIKDKYITNNEPINNRDILEILLKNNIIKVDNVRTLINKDKLVIENSDSLLQKYDQTKGK